MITKVYIDNFRCFEYFGIELGPFHLLLGENGTGKSTFFDVLSRLRSLLTGAGVAECFPSSDLTAWDSRTTQDFALEMRLGDDEYAYELRIQHKLNERTQGIARERVLWNSKTLYHFEEGEAHLYAFAGSGPVESGTVPMDWSRSYIPLLPERSDNLVMASFRKAVNRWVTVRLVPPQMEAFSKEEMDALSPDGRNFSSWYRHLMTEHPQTISPILECLQEPIPGLRNIPSVTRGEGKLLKVKVEGMSRALSFSEVSDGQRALIALYSLLHAVRFLGYNLHIDEPDNYVCLREIQPWLTQLEELCTEGNSQALLISHHPELINRLAKDYGIWFSRPDNGPVRVRKGYPVVEGLTAAETMARGWDDEE